MSSTIRRELRLAIRALKTAQAHLSSAEAQSAQTWPTRRAVRAIWDEVRDVQRDAHLLDAKLSARGES